MSQHNTRTFKIESIRTDEKLNGFWATLSTEYPVERGYGHEILMHESVSINLERVPLPLLISHNSEELNIGVVEKIEIIGRKLKGLIRLGKSERALEILEDIKDGVLTNLSIGYQITEHHMNGDDVIATKWTPHEVSLVSIGADPLAGIGRSLKSNTGNYIMNTENNTSNSNEVKLSRSQRNLINKATEDERERVRDIQSRSEYVLKQLPESASKARNLVADEVNRYIDNGWGSGDFANRLRDIWKMNVPNESTSAPASHSNIGFDNTREFSIVNIIRSAVDPKTVDIGHELEVSKEISQINGYRGKGILIPLGKPNIAQRSINTSLLSQGGAMVEEILHSDRFIDALVPQSTILNLGITQMNDLQGDAAIPRADSNPSVNAYNLDDVDTIAATDPAFSQIILSPKSLAGITVLSHKMIMQGSSDIESIVRRMLATSIAVEMDRQSIQGDGVGSNITGVTNTTGIGSVTYALGGNPTWADVVNLEAELTADNVAMDNVAYLVHPLMAATLKTTEVATNTGRFILENGLMNGRPVHVSTNVPIKDVLIGAWSEFLLGMWGSVALEIDPYSDFRKGNVQVRCILDWDASVRHEQAFAVLTESLV